MKEIIKAFMPLINKKKSRNKKVNIRTTENIFNMNDQIVEMFKNQYNLKTSAKCFEMLLVEWSLYKRSYLVNEKVKAEMNINGEPVSMDLLNEILENETIFNNLLKDLK
jgi:hypothetical protein